MAAAHRPRVLFLHTTALSDAEYTAYFDALHDIMDEPDQAGGPVNTKSIDENLEAHVIGIREARAWMRGRFRDMGNLSNVDKVCLIQFHSSYGNLSSMVSYYDLHSRCHPTGSWDAHAFRSKPLYLGGAVLRCAQASHACTKWVGCERRYAFHTR